MSKSKIAIVIAPGVCSFYIASITAAVATAGGVALIVPLLNSESSAEDILEMSDGIILVCPEQGTAIVSTQQSCFFRYIGRAAVYYGINAVALIGDRSHVASEQDWQDWAFFRRSSARPIDLAGQKGLEDLSEFVTCASTVSAFARLARSNRRSLEQELRSPVTHG